jgi:hypothetical protein
LAEQHRGAARDGAGVPKVDNRQVGLRSPLKLPTATDTGRSPTVAGVAEAGALKLPPVSPSSTETVWDA